MKKVAGILLRVLLLAAGIFLVVMAGKKLIARKKAALAKAPVASARPLPVRMATVRQGKWAYTRSYVAVVEPRNEAVLAAQLTAQIQDVRVDEGDQVKHGDLLISLDNRTLLAERSGVEAKIAQTEAEIAANQATVESLASTLEYWKKQAARDRKLADSDTIPEVQAETTENHRVETFGKLAAAKKKTVALQHLIAALKDQISGIETRIDYCRITSPYDGSVRYRYVDPGDLATPGKKLLVVAEHAHLQLAFDAPQTDLADLKQGSALYFQVRGKTYQARITHLYPSLNQARMKRIEAAIPAADGLICGETVTANVILESRPDVALAPRAAIVEKTDGTNWILTVKDHCLQPQPVTLLPSNDDWVGVEGVKPGTRVATCSFLGWAKLPAGRKVEEVR